MARINVRVVAKHPLEAPACVPVICAEARRFIGRPVAAEIIRTTSGSFRSTTGGQRTSASAKCKRSSGQAMVALVCGCLPGSADALISSATSDAGPKWHRLWPLGVPVSPASGVGIEGRWPQGTSAKSVRHPRRTEASTWTADECGKLLLRQSV